MIELNIDPKKNFMDIFESTDESGYIIKGFTFINNESEISLSYKCKINGIIVETAIDFNTNNELGVYYTDTINKIVDALLVPDFDVGIKKEYVRTFIKHIVYIEEILESGVPLKWYMYGPTGEELADNPYAYDMEANQSLFTYSLIKHEEGYLEWHGIVFINEVVLSSVLSTRVYRMPQV